MNTPPMLTVAGLATASIDDAQSMFESDRSAHAVDVILERHTESSVTARILSNADREGVIAFGTKSEALTAKSAIFALQAGHPTKVTINGLNPDTQYFYRLITREASGIWISGSEHSFHTHRWC